MKKVRVAVLGATGYSGVEAVRILLRHPHVEIAAVTAEQHVGQRLSAVHPALRGCDRVLEAADPDRLAERIDVAIGALPEAASAACLPPPGRCRSTSHRRQRRVSHQKRRASPPVVSGRSRAGAAAPGRVRIDRTAPRRDRRRALGCQSGLYPTGALLPLLPLLRGGAIRGPIIVDAKSGVSGARRKAAIEQLFCEINSGSPIRDRRSPPRP